MGEETTNRKASVRKVRNLSADSLEVNVSKRDRQNASVPPSQGRPKMPASYGLKKERTKGMVSWSTANARLAKAHNYWIVTARRDGRVHAAPVWGLWLHNTFYFSTDPNSRKGRNLATNPNLVVHLESGDDAVIIAGSAEFVTDKSSLLLFANRYQKKYQFRPDINDSQYGIYKVKPRTVCAWTEKNFPDSATRWVFQT